MIALLTVGGILLFSTYIIADEVKFERVAGLSQTPKTASTPPLGEEVGPEDVIRITTNLVSIPVRVMDEKGRYVHDMRAEEFQIFEDGVEQRIAFFAPC